MDAGARAASTGIPTVIEGPELQPGERVVVAPVEDAVEDSETIARRKALLWKLRDQQTDDELIDAIDWLTDAAQADGHYLLDSHDKTMAELRAAEALVSRYEKALSEAAESVERDRREPDKLLCHVQSIRSALARGSSGRPPEGAG